MLRWKERWMWVALWSGFHHFSWVSSWFCLVWGFFKSPKKFNLTLCLLFASVLSSWHLLLLWLLLLSWPQYGSLNKRTWEINAINQLFRSSGAYEVTEAVDGGQSQGQRYFQLLVFLLFCSALKFTEVLMLTRAVMDASRVWNAWGRLFGCTAIMDWFHLHSGIAVKGSVRTWSSAWHTDHLCPSQGQGFLPSLSFPPSLCPWQPSVIRLTIFICSSTH